MRFTLGAFLQRWHRVLDLPKQTPPSWYSDILAGELQELREATTPIEKLSETSDVFFSIMRAKYDGYPIGELPPLNSWWHFLVYVYMIGKFTSRWGFYCTTGRLCGGSVREVVNPKKDSKLEGVARRHGIDVGKFVRMGRRVRRVWPLFP